MTPDKALPVELDALRELAGCILTSSTIERYARCVAGSRAVLNLRAAVTLSPDRSRDFLDEAWTLWKQVLGSSQRSEAEVALAALLYALTYSGVRGIDELLLACALSVSPTAAWVSSFSRRLLAHRAGSRRVAREVAMAVLPAMNTANASDGRLSRSAEHPKFVTQSIKSRVSTATRNIPPLARVA